jgi:shikimate kinase
MNIAIIGFRGTGKTTVSKLLAKRLDKKLVCFDDEIEKRTKLGIDKIVKKHGWDKFREIEADIVDNISDLDECVFDTGGGIVVRNENIINLKRNAIEREPRYKKAADYAIDTSTLTPEEVCDLIMHYLETEMR